MAACESCNISYSLDEEYVACVLACMAAETTNPELLENSKVKKTLNRKPALHKMIQNEWATAARDLFWFDITRFTNIIRKLAVGHAAFELSLVFRDEPSKLDFSLISSMPKSELDDYDRVTVVEQLGEVGCRNIQRMYVVEAKFKSVLDEEEMVSLIVNDWVEVQDGTYRYHTQQSDDGVQVKIVLGEYMACTVFWAY